MDTVSITLAVDSPAVRRSDEATHRAAVRPGRASEGLGAFLRGLWLCPLPPPPPSCVAGEEALPRGPPWLPPPAPYSSKRRSLAATPELPVRPRSARDDPPEDKRRESWSRLLFSSIWRFWIFRSAVRRSCSFRRSWVAEGEQPFSTMHSRYLT